jgi:hypothetical protein
MHKFRMKSMQIQPMLTFGMLVQLLGFSNGACAMLVVCWRMGIAVGNSVGGALGDVAAARLPNSGRVLVSQTGLLLATPLCIILFRVMPGECMHGLVPLYNGT